MSADKQPLILIVEDEQPTRNALLMALQDDYDLFAAENLRQAQDILNHEPVDIVLTDLRLGGDSGMDVLTSAQKAPSKPLCIMMTAYGSVDTAVEATKRGAFHFLTKPLNLDEVDLMLKRALHTRKLEQRNTELEVALSPKRGLENMLGKSDAIERIFHLIQRVAPTRSTVLIEGESGTGKELAAHAIHKLSPRADKAFVVVNCAALSPQLLESELFGHEKGSFTGAMQKRIGRFEQADGGTIFLDEIGEIDQATQVKLLRVLSERTIERVGSNTPVTVDVRIIAATNKSLAVLVADGIFREDLFFRLNVINIHMPPLRERKEDILILTNSFLKEYAHEQNTPVKHLSNQAMQLLLSYPWPGNVRELKTAIEHGVIMALGTTIEPQHLPATLSSSLPQDAPSHALPGITEGKNTSHAHIALVNLPTLNLSSLEAEAINQALIRANGNKTQAAAILGISRRTLQRKLSDI